MIVFTIQAWMLQNPLVLYCTVCVCVCVCVCVFPGWASRRMSVFCSLWGRTEMALSSWNQTLTKGRNHTGRSITGTLPHHLYPLVNVGVLSSLRHLTTHLPLLLMRPNKRYLSDTTCLCVTRRVETNGEKKEVWRLTLDNVSTAMAAEDKEKEQHMYKDVSSSHVKLKV